LPSKPLIAAYWTSPKVAGVIAQVMAPYAYLGREPYTRLACDSPGLEGMPAHPGCELRAVRWHVHDRPPGQGIRVADFTTALDVLPAFAPLACGLPWMR
jgi:hypothetical protein